MTPTRLGPFRIERKLGRGGMGTVFAGVDDATGEWAAIKVISPTLAADDGFRQRFAAEIESLKRLMHPGIVRLYGFGQEDECLYYVMELVAGPSLQEELEAGRRFDWREVTELAVQICRALRHAHDHGVVHRDLKPANLLLQGGEFGVQGSGFGVQGSGSSDLPRTTDGERNSADRTLRDSTVDPSSDSSPLNPEPRTPSSSPLSPELQTPPPTVKLTDFGIARMFGTRLTGSGGVIGTAEYMAPEQADGRPATHRCDLYSLGCVMYALLSGRPPFRAATFPAMLHAHRYELPERVGAYAPDTPRDLEAIVARLLAKQPEDRFANAVVVARELEAMRNRLRLVPESALPETPAVRADVRADVGERTFITAVEARRAEQPLPTSVWRTLLLPQTLAIALALAAVVGGIVYLSRGPSLDAMFERVEAAAGDDDPERLLDVETDVERLLEKLPRDDPRYAAVEGYRDTIDLVRLDRRIRRRNGNVQRLGQRSPVERLYADALAQSQVDPDRAAATLQNLLDLFDVASETSPEARRCVTLSKRQLERLRPLVERRQADHLALIRQKLDQAEKLQSTDPKAAATIRQAIARQYADKPWAAEWVNRAKAGVP